MLSILIIIAGLISINNAISLSKSSRPMGKVQEFWFGVFNAGGIFLIVIGLIHWMFYA